MKTTFHVSDRAVKLIRWGAFTAVVAVVAVFLVAIFMAAIQGAPSSGDSQPDPRCTMPENWVVTDKTHGRVLYEQLDLDSLETRRLWISCPDI